MVGQRAVSRQPSAERAPLTADRSPLNAASEASLPTLVPGRDRLPSACPHCGSGFLSSEEPLGRHAWGTVSCQTCSRTLCWTSRPLPEVSPRRQQAASRRQVWSGETVRPVVVRRPVISGRFERLAGCGRACSPFYGHDAASHEAYGRAQVVTEQEARRSGIVRTGPLAVDFDAVTVTAYDRPIALSPLERGLLFVLADHLGRAVSHRTLVETVWGHAQADIWAEKRTRKQGRWHSLRVRFTYLRVRLGEHADLIETVKGHGFRLRAVPPFESGILEE